MSGGVPDGCFDVGAGRGVFSTMEECKAACGKRPALPPSAPPSTGPKNWVCQTLPNGTRSCGYLAPDDGRRPPNFQGGYSTYEECLASGCGSGGGAGGGGGGGGGIGIGNPGAGGSSRPPLPCITYWNNNSRPPQFVQIGDCPPNGGGGGQRPGFPGGGGGGGGGRPIFPGVQPPLRPQPPTLPPKPGPRPLPINQAGLFYYCYFNPNGAAGNRECIAKTDYFKPQPQFGRFAYTEEGYTKCLAECAKQKPGAGKNPPPLERPEKCFLLSKVIAKPLPKPAEEPVVKPPVPTFDPVTGLPKATPEAVAIGDLAIDEQEYEWTCECVKLDFTGKPFKDLCNGLEKAMTKAECEKLAAQFKGQKPQSDKPCSRPIAAPLPIAPAE